jgi:hypothetical protein
MNPSVLGAGHTMLGKVVHVGQQCTIATLRFGEGS